MVDTIYEKGDSLHSLALKAREWFNKNDVEVPSGAKLWQTKSVRKKEIPPGTGVTSLRRYGFNVTEFISAITGNADLKAYNYNPITSDNIGELGFIWLSDTLVKGHRKVTVQCLKCSKSEELDYGTLQKMKKASNIHCRYCRGVGGKHKSINTYDIFEGFTVVEQVEDRIRYKCDTCSSIIERTMSHVNTTSYLVCEICNPRENFGARMYTEYGYFDSAIEYRACQILLKYLEPEQIIRQKKYDELFNTGTKHTADFYIPHIPLVLEVTSKYNKIGDKYKETAEWKKSLSKMVIFAYSLKEVEDIVRPLSKDSGLNVENC